MNSQYHIFINIGFGLTFLFISTLIGEGIYNMMKKKGGITLFFVGLFFLMVIGILFVYLTFYSAS